MPRLMQNVEWAILYIRGMLISWVVANHENNEIKTPWIFCHFTVVEMYLFHSFQTFNRLFVILAHGVQEMSPLILMTHCLQVFTN